MQPHDDTTGIDAFIDRWQGSGAAERANYQLFLVELCDLLRVPRPEPARDDGAGDYRFEYPVAIANRDGTTRRGFIDLYKRGAFVLETKQGADRRLQQEALPLFGLHASGGATKQRVGHGVRGSASYALSLGRAREREVRSRSICFLIHSTRHCGQERSSTQTSILSPPTRSGVQGGRAVTLHAYMRDFVEGGHMSQLENKISKRIER